MVHPPRIPSKNEYQRYLHESYQYVIHLIVEQQRIEDERRINERDNGRRENEEQDLFANVKKIRERIRSASSRTSICQYDTESIASSK